MQEFKKFITDPRFYLPLAFLVGFELFMQSGLYTHLLKPKTYAENVNRIVSVVESSPVEPDVLILGTSIAYQGINLPLLNERSAPDGPVYQSGATEGAMLITQHTLYHRLKRNLPGLKTVLHVVETTMPWTARFDLDPANRSMIAQFDRWNTLQRARDYRYRIDLSDELYFWIRTITYQADLRDFTLSPAERLKRLGREYRKEDDLLYPYINEQPYGMDVYESADLHECIQKARNLKKMTDREGNPITDIHHREAVEKTCQLGLADPMDTPGQQEWERLFFHRLGLFYREILKDGHNLVIVFPPYSRLIQDHREPERMLIWKRHLDEILKGHPRRVIDLRRSLDGPDNLSLYYDTIHLNRKGSLRFTRILADSLAENPIPGRIDNHQSAAESQP